jgi:hypothetical protein
MEKDEFYGLMKKSRKKYLEDNDSLRMREDDRY